MIHLPEPIDRDGIDREAALAARLLPVILRPQPQMVRLQNTGWRRLMDRVF
jgi:hypothetical protein